MNEVSNPKGQTPVPASARTIAHLALVYVAALFGVVFLQYSQGAFRSEFGGHPDEAAHCVTGLFVHDAIKAELGWLFHGMHGSPVAVGKSFTDTYYGAYPKIGLGIWPPFFYLVQSAWYCVFPACRSSLLLLMAALTAALALLLYRSLREEFGGWFAVAGTAIFLTLPLIQGYSAMVMAEILSGLLMFAAALRLGRFIDGNRTRDALAFGVLASLAILTKGTGLALALTALIALGLTFKKAYLRSPALVYSAGIVVILAGPWTWFFRNQGKGGWEEPAPSWHYTKAAFPYYCWKSAICLGALLLLLALIGFCARAFRKGPFTGKWTVMGALVLSVCVFQSIAPAGREARHLVPIMPALILFAFAGLKWIADALNSSQIMTRKSEPLVAGLVSILFFMGGLVGVTKPVGFGSVGDELLFSPFTIRQKGYEGFGPVAATLVSKPGKPVILVSSDARGEGMMISETALSDSNRPSYVVQRASKLMAASTWGGGSYQSYFGSEEALMKFILDSQIRYLVIDADVPAVYRKPHHEMLARLVRNHPEVFKPVMETKILREGLPQSQPLRVCEVDRNPRQRMAPM